MTLSILIASLPSPSRSEFSIGPLHLRAYGLMIAFGVIAAIWLLGRQLERKGIGTSEDASSIGIWGVGAGIIGARLYHVATDWERFSDNLAAIPKIWEGGLGIPGGLLLGIVVGAWQSKRRGIPPAMLLTCAAPAIPLAQAIGRWGNWFNQELYGKPTDLPWALEIDNPTGYPPGTTFHPTFLYESLWNFGLVAVLLWIDRTLRLGPGRLLAVYVMGYGVGRFWIEGLRIDPAREVGGLRWNQWVALAAIVGGALYLLVTHGKKWPDPVVRDESTDESPEGVVPDESTEGAAPDESTDDRMVPEGAVSDEPPDDDDHVEGSPID
jgi:prolipoprotein diacylglyceryl transferase